MTISIWASSSSSSLLLLLLLLLCTAAASEDVLVSRAKVYIDGRRPMGTTDSNYVCATLDWWPPEKCDYGTCSWGHSSLLNLNLSSPLLLNAVKAFSPLKLRLGGTLQDKVIYDMGDQKLPCASFHRNESEMFGFTQGCLSASRWDQLNAFFQKSGAMVVFGLNALNGRVPLPDGSVGGPWNATNAASLIKYTAKKSYPIYGWELGNELSGTGIGTRIDVGQYAADVKKLKYLIDTIYYKSVYKPRVLAPGGFFDEAWFEELVNQTRPNSLDVISHHIYNLGPGVDNHLMEKILDPSCLDGEAGTFRSLQKIIKDAKTSTTAWVGEAGGAYNSGHNRVTNAFVFSFWYLDQLGMAALYDTKTYCRQTLIGGNYGLLDTTTFAPNPDYYSALLWHKMMGQNALATNFTGTGKIRAYAHCARQTRGISLLLINLGNTTIQITATRDPTLHRRHKRKMHGKRTDQLQSLRRRAGHERKEFHLTAKNGDLHSQTMLLNGNVLAADALGNIPGFRPLKRNASEPIVVAAFSIVFAHIPHFYAPACR